MFVPVTGSITSSTPKKFTNHGSEFLMEVSSPTKKKKKTRKGPPFERAISKTLSLWISNGERDDLVWRTSGSGARAKTRSKQGKTTANSCGDLKAEDALALPLFADGTFELKNGYGDYCILDCLDIKKRGKKGTAIEEFYKQSADDSKNAGVPFSFLICRKDRRESLLYLPNTVFQKLTDIVSGLDTDVSRIEYIPANNIMPHYVILALTDFLSSVTFKQFVKATKAARKLIK